MPSKFICLHLSMLVQVENFHSFLKWVSNIPLCVCVCVYHIFFIHSSVDRHTGCFHILAIVNNAAMNTGVHIYFWISEDWGQYISRSGTAGSYGSSNFSFLKTLHLVHCWWEYKLVQSQQNSVNFWKGDEDVMEGMLAGSEVYGPILKLLASLKYSVQFSHSVVSDSLRPHELQHARPACPSPAPAVYPNSCPLSQWCHRTISSSVVPFSSCLQSFSASGSFPMSQLFAWGGQSIGISASTSVLPMNTQDWSPLRWTGWITLQAKGLSRVFSNTTVQKHQFFCA